jgi:hypothetical protein
MKFKFFKGETFNRNICWRSENGRDRPIFYMTSDHINNILLCLNGEGNMEIPNPYNGRTHEEWINIFNRELRERINENG